MTLCTRSDSQDTPVSEMVELIGGSRYIRKPPSAPEAWVISEIGYEIRGPFGRGRDGPGGWRIVPGPELLLGGDIVLP